MPGPSSTAEPGWVCSQCGNPGAKPIGFTAIDQRYQTGYCDFCTAPIPTKPRKTARPTSPLVRADYFDEVRFQERHEKDELQVLVRGFAAGKGNVQLSDKQVARLVELYDKWGSPGFYLPDNIREAAEKYAKSFAALQDARGKKKRR